MHTEFASVGIFIVLGFVFVTAGLFFAGFIRPNRPNQVKNRSYECGELPVGPGRTQFNIRFYLIAFMFVIFDVEAVFIFPVATVYKKMIESGLGMTAFFEIAIFVGILLVGLVYAWQQGALAWVCGKSGVIPLDSRPGDKGN